MYTSLFTLFVEVLGYPKSSVIVDTAGARGRPDLTVFAPGGNAGSRVTWMVVEAKDERGSVATPARRAKLFAEKAKYITSDTAYFVMVDPVMLVARSSGLGQSSNTDIELPWASTTLEAFADALAPLNSGVAGVPEVLGRFRSGDESLIATNKLSTPDTATEEDKLAAGVARNVFFDTLSETTGMLQTAVGRALAATQSDRAEIMRQVKSFEDDYGPISFRPYPISVEGTAARGREKDQQHRRDAAALRAFLVRRSALSRLTLDALPRFAQRIGADPVKDATKIERFFANETASLILARILLIRFLEDHGFFDRTSPDGTVKRRYLCNGGVAAFQGMRTYFEHGYTRLLEEAYRNGGQFYSAAFDETEMDWVIALSEAELSRTVEWVLFRVARFDFATARGDLMSGVYDRFLDRKQRKEQGEYYTPPSIARYILERLQLSATAEVLDPACGSGTFLIERYRQVIGDDVDRGLASYAEAKTVVESMSGNDLNPFSAVLSQIQILWHLLNFGDAIKLEGFPDIHVSERANSLVPGGLYDPSQSRFPDIDRTGYDAVIGNPPYVRSERGAPLEAHAEDYFSQTRTVGATTYRGLTPGANAYTLFMYRALDHWCRQPGGELPAGKLGFIVPLAFCGAGESADLRALFQLGGRWSIREIVDMELIWQDVFDADVLPMILIAEATPALETDKVKLRLADETCVKLEHGSRTKRPTFDFAALTEKVVDYADLFTPDGRIVTRMTPERAAILKKVRANQTLRDAAMPYWSKRSAGRKATPPTGYGASTWKEERLLQDGAAVRGDALPVVTGGLDVYKGENVTATMLTGKPRYAGVDVSALTSASVWSEPSILPEKMYALPIIEQVPVAAPFDPRTTAMLNTVTVFGPRHDLASVPFDIVLLSTVYAYTYVLSGRRSFMNKIRSHIYPASVGELPWNDALAGKAAELTLAGEELVKACRKQYDGKAELNREADGLGLVPLTDVIRPTLAKLGFSETFETEKKFILQVGDVERVDDEIWSIPLDDDGTHFITLTDENIARFAQAGLARHDGDESSKTAVQRTAIPPSDNVMAALTALRGTYETTSLEAAVYAAVGAIDAIVGPAFGLSEDDILAIQTDMTTDPFLASVRPRYPHFRPRQRGGRAGLDSSNRYGPERKRKSPSS